MSISATEPAKTTLEGVAVIYEKRKNEAAIDILEYREETEVKVVVKLATTEN